jgi:PAS domain-containing protein
MKFKRKDPLPGTTKANIQILEALHEKMWAIRNARHRTLGSDVNLCAIYQEAVELYIPTIDLETGLPKPRPAPLQMPDKPFLAEITEVPAALAELLTNVTDAAAVNDRLQAHVRALQSNASQTRPRPAHLPLFHDWVNCNAFLSDDQLRAAMDRAFWLMVWMSAPDNRCLHVNPLLVAYTGRPLPAWLDAGWADAMHPEDRERVYQDCALKCEARQPMYNEYRMRRIDEVWARVVDQAVPRYLPDYGLGRPEDGAFAGYIGTIYQTN